MAMKRFVLLGAVMLLAAGCSSVNLDNNAQVEDRTGGAAGGDTAVAKTTVVAVDDGKAATDAVATMERLVYFDYDSHAIKPQFQALLETNARYIKANSQRKVVIEGHTDERGGREYNLALGQRRAEAVRRALGLLGVADSRIEAVSFGKEKPAAPGNDEAAWSRNRRAEISYR